MLLNTISKISVLVLLITSINYSAKASSEVIVDDDLTMPSYSAAEEAPAQDSVFEAQCLDEARAIARSENWTLLKPTITMNSKFGLVWRADFRFPDGVDEHVNRVILWKLPNGHFGRFFGSNLHVAPLAPM